MSEEQFPFQNLAYRKRNTITRKEIEDVQEYTQGKAAKLLGISVSTLKKRFKELNPGVRWGDLEKEDIPSGVEEKEDDEAFENDEEDEEDGPVEDEELEEEESSEEERKKRRKRKPKKKKNRPKKQEVDERLTIAFLLNEDNEDPS